MFNMFNWIAKTEDRLLRFWLLTFTSAGFFLTLWGIYTLIYAFNRFTVLDNTTITLTGGLVCLVTVTCLKTQTIRGWVVVHPWICAFIGSLVDGLTEYFLLTDPIVKFICDAFATYMWFQIWVIQGEERLQSILDYSANKRIRFKLNQDICRSVGIIGASLVAMFFPDIPIEWVVWLSIISCVFSYYFSACRYVAADVFMRNHGLKYPYLEKQENPENN